MTTTAATTPSPSFPRWALGVLAPLAVYEAVLFIFTDKHSPSVGFELIPMVYVATFKYQYGVFNSVSSGVFPRRR